MPTWSSEHGGYVDESGARVLRRALPSLPRLALRFALVSAVLLAIGGRFATALVEPLAPALGRAVDALSPDFVIADAAVDRGGTQAYVAFRCNLRHVVFIGSGQALPLGYGTAPAGWYVIKLTTGGILQHALFLSIIVFAWPARLRELALRLLLAMPVIGLLILQHVAVTVLAELWFPIHEQLAPQEFWPLFAWSRFLMGGGGLVLAMALGALIIALAARADRALSTRADHGPAVANP